MRFIFIDLGAYNGDTIKEFLNWGHLILNPQQFEIFGFEPNPKFMMDLLRLEQAKPNIKFSNSAAWICDGETDFAVDKSDLPYGSTLMKSKPQWEKGKIVKVKCFDFSKWIEQFAGDYVLVKMDIEGAEFPVLEKMLKDGTVKIISRLLVEFHSNKVKEYTTADKDDLVSRLRKFTVVSEWH